MVSGRLPSLGEKLHNPTIFENSVAGIVLLEKGENARVAQVDIFSKTSIRGYLFFAFVIFCFAQNEGSPRKKTRVRCTGVYTYADGPCSP